MLERRIYDHWNFAGDPSDSWTAFTRFTILDEKPPDGYTWSGERLTKKQTTSTPDRHVRSGATERKIKVRVSTNRSLTVLKGCEVFTSLIQQMRSSRKLKKMRGESWRFRCQQQCLAEPDAKRTGKLVAFWTIVRQNTHASLKPTNPRESVWNLLYQSKMDESNFSGGDQELRTPTFYGNTQFEENFT